MSRSSSILRRRSSIGYDVESFDDLRVDSPHGLTRERGRIFRVISRAASTQGTPRAPSKLQDISGSVRDPGYNRRGIVDRIRSALAVSPAREIGHVYDRAAPAERRTSLDSAGAAINPGIRRLCIGRIFSARIARTCTYVQPLSWIKRTPRPPRPPGCFDPLRRAVLYGARLGPPVTHTNEKTRVLHRSKSDRVGIEPSSRSAGVSHLGKRVSIV